MVSWLRDVLWEMVPRDQRDTDAGLRRRQIVTVVTVLVGAAVLGFSLRIEPGSPAFYASTCLLAAVWAAGALASGRLHLGRLLTGGRPIVPGILLGLLLSAVFVLGALVVRLISPLADYVASVLAYADEGSVPVLVVITAVNGIAEEVFYRGGLWRVLSPRKRVLWTTVAYTAVTALTGIPLLALAAAMRNEGRLIACDTIRDRLRRLEPRAERARAKLDWLLPPLRWASARAASSTGRNPPPSARTRPGTCRAKTARRSCTPP